MQKRHIGFHLPLKRYIFYRNNREFQITKIRAEQSE